MCAGRRVHGALRTALQSRLSGQMTDPPKEFSVLQGMKIALMRGEQEESPERTAHLVHALGARIDVGEACRGRKLRFAPGQLADARRRCRGVSRSGSCRARR